MPRLTKDLRNQLVGILRGGTLVSDVARHSNVSRQTRVIQHGFERLKPGHKILLIDHVEQEGKNRP